jgi:hypothetical protein
MGSPVVLCDLSFAGLCDQPATITCRCSRCRSEPEVSERFHCCRLHSQQVDAMHRRVRERPADWSEGTS